ncbi:tetratricopeptide repeat protein [candidate division WOR-3 bacterium]|nr:tetratricopeptide repeat protein [candidate division WOR-3 bacterium]
MRQIKRGHREEDEFRKIMKKFIKYVVRHRETSILVGIVILVGISFLVFTLSKSEQQNPAADLLHTQAMGLISMGRLQEAENILLDLTTRYQNTRPGKIGIYYLGTIYYHTGRFDESLENFDKFLSLQKKDYLLVPSALFGAGCSAEGLKDYERALGYYERAIKDKKSPFYFMGMLAYGRTNGLVGNTDKAREILKDLVAQNPPSDIANDARFYIGYFND